MAMRTIIFIVKGFGAIKVFAILIALISSL